MFAASADRCACCAKMEGSEAVLKCLRAAMRSSKYVSEPLSAYIVPTDDAHQVHGACRPAKTTMFMRSCVHEHAPPSLPPSHRQNEYIANCHKRREFLTGFTGSAGPLTAPLTLTLVHSTSHTLTPSLFTPPPSLIPPSTLGPCPF